MATNLLRVTWTNLDPYELRLVLDDHFGHPGQYDGPAKNRLYLPLAGSSCRLALTFRDRRIVAIEPGPAFDGAEWQRISEEIEISVLAGPMKVGREYSFSSFRVTGSWRGDRSGVQILPPPDGTPRAPVEIAQHPFILEFPVRASDRWRLTNYRRLREHRKLTLLLNILLAGRTSLQARQSEHLWALVPRDDHGHEIKWVQPFFFAKLGNAVSDRLSPRPGERLEELEPREYYTTVGHDGMGLRVPTDLDESLCCYTALSADNRGKFDRATFWIDVASRQWSISFSASFAALVSAIKSLTGRGDVHQFECPICHRPTQHEVPGAVRRFKDFFDTYASGGALAKQRDDMYSLRSGILHGGNLMQFDLQLDFGWDPPAWNERELHQELWGLTRVALRNWLKNPY